MKTSIYQSNNKIRIVTAASLFDGHDAAINIMRRIIQSTGVEVIHLGHDRSVDEVVNTAIAEDVQGIAMTSYQGGHVEYFKYMHDLLQEKGAGHIKIFAGGGGVILPDEIKLLEQYGITKIYSPDDGRVMGLQGMINHMIESCDFPTGKNIQIDASAIKNQNPKALAQAISAVENFSELHREALEEMLGGTYQVPVLGITGTGGAGKSSMVDEIIRRFSNDFPEKKLAIISVDPSKRKTGGALLGDRIRMNAVNHPNIFMRSLATRQANLALSSHISDALQILKYAGFDWIILETSGIGQSDTEILEHSDKSLYIMTPEYGAATQLEKIDMIDFADLIALNKFDKRGALDALRDVQKQVQRNQNRWEEEVSTMPVIGTMASQFNDPGTNRLYLEIIKLFNWTSNQNLPVDSQEKKFIIPPKRNRYLSEISDGNRNYNQQVESQSKIAQQLFGIYQSILGLTDLEQTQDHLTGYGLNQELLKKDVPEESQTLFDLLLAEFDRKKLQFAPLNWEKIRDFQLLKKQYSQDQYTFKVRDKEISMKLHESTLSHSKIPKVSLPKFTAWGDLLKWIMQENVPGQFPFTAGLFPFKRAGEDPTRMFAGEGGPERTNKRFHYVSLGMLAKRLSTAFDSVTLYGNDPDRRPDIYGKIGNSGVSICCLDDAKKLFSGFDLAAPLTSVSLTINGPAPMLLGYFLNTAIDQQCEKYIKENGLEKEVDRKIEKLFKGSIRPTYQGDLPEGNDGLGLYLLGLTGDQVLPASVYQKIKAATLQQVRGTVQADILKEDQAQNTCIFSTEFSLKLMGDVQEYFNQNKIKNFYSVSISGYHIAEAGANPITQLALTLANGFTYVEYYLERGMNINDFGPNLSFFFSNGIDAEYAVIGRVARKIWAKAMKYKYGANERAQKLKYHIQTSGRSLHAQEIDFNDIRTTLQALYAIYDNCNSLHTNAYDEAITTPTEESVRRAMAIQLIINKELGLTKNENPIQGAFIIEELTDLVEQAVYEEFDRITERGGVLGAMETMYQRNKIQEESLYYETLKHEGKLPIVGVNTFLNAKGSPTSIPNEVIRATLEEKETQITNLNNLHQRHPDQAKDLLASLAQAAKQNENLFETLIEVTKYCSLGQITDTLFEVGGQYRRNM
ncbi:methylmalonyl-CoA mutase family protein [Flavobacteriaceae bacterium]|nr:methylmalonyl-CoA mutase family protein [Flavobacteriaceae bacterium]